MQSSQLQRLGIDVRHLMRLVVFAKARVPPWSICLAVKFLLSFE